LLINGEQDRLQVKLRNCMSDLRSYKDKSANKRIGHSDIKIPNRTNDYSTQTALNPAGKPEIFLPDGLPFCG
jgi:hypothetical protein